VKWQRQDALSFERLTRLAQVLGADRLVLGWITTLSIEGPQPMPDGNGPGVAQADVVVQIFDAGQDRVVAETRSSASTIGDMQEILVRSVLRDAVAPVVPWLVTQLSRAASCRTAIGAASCPPPSRGVD
jgi:hypothetical protein